jgi:hypothetical protein
MMMYVENSLPQSMWAMPTLQLPEWTDKKNIPFANSEGYVAEEEHYQKEVGYEDVLVTWEYGELSPVAYIYVHENLLGVVGDGDKPGYSRYAVMDGPLAGRVGTAHHENFICLLMNAI